MLMEHRFSGDHARLHAGDARHCCSQSDHGWDGDAFSAKSSVRLDRPVRCVVFDMDGVLLDTEIFYTRVTQQIVGRYGKTFDWTIKSHMVGRPAIESARYLVETLSLPILPEEYLAGARPSSRR